MDITKIAVEVFNKHANLYQTKFMDVSLYADSLNQFCNTIKQQDTTILELACGPGNITKHLLSKRPDFKVLGTDLSPNMIALAKVNNPTAKFEIMDCRDIVSLNEDYDAIMCGFILPYLSMTESAKLFNDCYSRLRNNGVIYLSTMEGNYSDSGFQKGSTGDEIYMHFYNADDLSKLLIENGFEIINLSRVKSIMTNGAEVVDLIIIAEKKNDL